MARQRRGAAQVLAPARQSKECAQEGAGGSDSGADGGQCHPRKIFVGGLAHKTTTGHLRDYFARFGSVVDTVVLRWTDGRSRGFGYVTFAEVESITAVMQEQHVIGGRQVDVKRAVPGTNKVFVGGLPQSITVPELRSYFEAFGVVSDAVVMIDANTKRSRGFGFVSFLAGQEGADAVAAALDQYDRHKLHGKWIEVKSAAPPHKLPETSPSGSACCSTAPTEGYSEEDPQLWSDIKSELDRGQRKLCSSSATTQAGSTPPSMTPPNTTPPNTGVFASPLGTPRKVALPDMSGLLLGGSVVT